MMLFLCRHIYLTDKMGPEFGNWKSFPHNLKQGLPLPVSVTGRLISQLAMQAGACASWLYLQAWVMPSLCLTGNEPGTAPGVRLSSAAQVEGKAPSRRPSGAGTLAAGSAC